MILNSLCIFQISQEVKINKLLFMGCIHVTVQKQKENSFIQQIKTQENND